MKTININTQVQVTLTREGARVLYEYRKYLLENIFSDQNDETRDEVIKHYSPDTKGRIVHSLWKIMEIFGSSLANGDPTPFVGNSIKVLK
jgi:hypothetical protein